MKACQYACHIINQIVLNKPINHLIWNGNFRKRATYTTAWLILLLLLFFWKNLRVDNIGVKINMHRKKRDIGEVQPIWVITRFCTTLYRCTCRKRISQEGGIVWCLLAHFEKKSMLLQSTNWWNWDMVHINRIVVMYKHTGNLIYFTPFLSLLTDTVFD